MDDRSLSDMLEDGGEMKDWWMEMMGLEEVAGHQAREKNRVDPAKQDTERKAGGFNES